MGYDLEAFFEIVMKNGTASKKPIPTPLRVRTYLTKFCDLHAPLNKRQLVAIAMHVRDEGLRQHLQNLTTFEGESEFDQEIFGRKHSLFTFLAAPGSPV
jgi:NADPH-ferrihemoprotein reductase